MIVPVGRIILLRRVPKIELLKAMSFLSMPALLGPIIGPPLGGFLVTYASWHWIFLINIPVGILGIALVLRYIAAETPEQAPRQFMLRFNTRAAPPTPTLMASCCIIAEKLLARLISCELRSA